MTNIRLSNHCFSKPLKASSPFSVAAALTKSPLKQLPLIFAWITALVYFLLGFASEHCFTIQGGEK